MMPFDCSKLSNLLRCSGAVVVQKQLWCVGGCVVLQVIAEWHRLLRGSCLWAGIADGVAESFVISSNGGTLVDLCGVALMAISTNGRFMSQSFWLGLVQLVHSIWPEDIGW